MKGSLEHSFICTCEVKWSFMWKDGVSIFHMKVWVGHSLKRKEWAICPPIFILQSLHPTHCLEKSLVFCLLTMSNVRHSLKRKRSDGRAGGQTDKHFLFQTKPPPITMSCLLSWEVSGLFASLCIDFKRPHIYIEIVKHMLHKRKFQNDTNGKLS